MGCFFFFVFFVCAHFEQMYFLYDYTMHKLVACIVFNLRVLLIFIFEAAIGRTKVLKQG